MHPLASLLLLLLPEPLPGAAPGGLTVLAVLLLLELLTSVSRKSSRRVKLEGGVASPPVSRWGGGMKDAVERCETGGLSPITGELVHHECARRSVSFGRRRGFTSSSSLSRDCRVGDWLSALYLGYTTLCCCACGC